MKLVFEIEAADGTDPEAVLSHFKAMSKTQGAPAFKVTDITASHPAAAPGQYTLTFEKFWETYRNAEIPAGSKRNAFKQWRLEQIDGKGELFLDGLIEHIQTHAQRYHECRRLQAYYPPLPHAERFLKGGNWETEPPPMPATPSTGRPDGLRG